MKYRYDTRNKRQARNCLFLKKASQDTRLPGNAVSVESFCFKKGDATMDEMHALTPSKERQVATMTLQSLFRFLKLK